MDQGNGKQGVRSNKGQVKHAPIAQQIEGLKFVLGLVPFAVFIRSLNVLVREQFLSKSRKHWLVKQAREIQGVSWLEYQKMKSR